MVSSKKLFADLNRYHKKGAIPYADINSSIWLKIHQHEGASLLDGRLGSPVINLVSTALADLIFSRQELGYLLDPGPKTLWDMDK